MAMSGVEGGGRGVGGVSSSPMLKSVIEGGVRGPSSSSMPKSVVESEVRGSSSSSMPKSVVGDGVRSSRIAKSVARAGDCGTSMPRLC
jgi:hypothetical protein